MPPGGAVRHFEAQTRRPFPQTGPGDFLTDLEFFKDECSDKFSERGFWYHDTGPIEWKPEAPEQIMRAEFWQTLRGEVLRTYA